MKISTVRLELPFLAKFYLSRTRKRSYILGGLGVNTFLHWKAIYTYQLSPFEPRMFQDIEPIPLFINLLVGGGQEWEIGNMPWFFEAMYGTIPITTLPRFTYPQAAFRSFQFSVGTRF
jgi:hypothetical protein